jgi:predicted DNA-binding antitoxin AbrB/MazE fold protein
MTLDVEAIFENGVLKPKQPLKLRDGTELRLIVTLLDETDPLDAVLGICKGGPRDGADNLDKYVYRD